MGPTLTPGDHRQFHLRASGGPQPSEMESEPLRSGGAMEPRTQTETTAQGTEERMLQLFI